MSKFTEKGGQRQEKLLAILQKHSCFTLFPAVCRPQRATQIFTSFRSFWATKTRKLKVVRIVRYT